MAIGIKQSRLLADLLEGKKQNVPVGRTVVSHNIAKNPDTVMPLTKGQPLTSLHIEEFDVFGSSRQNQSVKRNDNTNSAAFIAREVVNDGLLVEGAFDPEDGTVNLVRRNGEVLVIPGMLVQADFGSGPTGPRGDPGIDAHDGYDGEDGPDGSSGCVGAEGRDGEFGPMGQPGADGPQGVPGPIGETGDTGIQGSMGPTGRYGHEGARGRKGSDCSNTAGPSGSSGVSGNGSVVISSSAPSAGVFLWGIPE